MYCWSSRHCPVGSAHCSLKKGPLVAKAWGVMGRFRGENACECPRERATAKGLREINTSRPSFGSRSILEGNQNSNKRAISLVLWAYKVAGRSPFVTTGTQKVGYFSTGPSHLIKGMCRLPSDGPGLLMVRMRVP